MPRFEIDRVYDRKTEIHGPFKGAGSGNETAGITKVGGAQCVFWNPYRKLYSNRWIEEPKEFIYSGEGNLGDMQEALSTNADLIRCEEDGTPVCVFYKVANGGSRWKHLGEFRVVRHGPGSSKDRSGNWRRDLRFQFRMSVESDADRLTKIPRVRPSEPPRLPTEEELWEILARSPSSKTTARKRRTYTSRGKRAQDPLKTMYVLSRVTALGGACELCQINPEWVASDGLPHYQAHHLNPDIDAVDWIAGICGTCHDRLHHSTDRVEVARGLREFIAQRHSALGHAPSVVGSDPPVVISDPLECFSVIL